MRRRRVRLGAFLLLEKIADTGGSSLGSQGNRTKASASSVLNEQQATIGTPGHKVRITAISSLPLAKTKAEQSESLARAILPRLGNETVDLPKKKERFASSNSRDISSSRITTICPIFSSSSRTTNLNTNKKVY